MTKRTSTVSKLLLSFGLAAACGGFSALLTRGSMEVYETIRQPPLAPPGLLFPIVWSILYFLMGLSAYLVLRNDDEDTRGALLLYIAQLLVNFLWSLLFFNARLWTVSFVWLLLLLVLVFCMIRAFAKKSRTAARLQIPYILWICFAGYLNLAIAILN